jgi:glycosyltransferase involved in cell wall biosynthesis
MFLRMEIDHAPLRVALVVPPYYRIPPAAYGGVETVVADLADALVESGHSVTLIGAEGAETKARFVRVWDRTMPERLGDSFPEVMNALRTRNSVREMVGRIDVVHDHTYSGSLNAEVYASWGVPTVVTMHGTAEHKEWRSYYRELGSNINLVAISARQRVLAPELNWIATVPNALRIEQWPYKARKDNYALFLGRFSADKGAHHAIDAAHEAGIPLVLAGKSSEKIEQEYLADVIRPMLGPDDVMFGVADAREKRILLANARCLLFPVQWEEPFGMVMIEAMACGTPVIALRAGAVPEVIDDGVTGIICDKPDQLAPAIDEVDRLDPAACRRHVAMRFNASTLARGYAGAYRTAINSLPRRIVSERHRTVQISSLAP